MDLYNEKINEFVDWVSGKLVVYKENKSTGNIEEEIGQDMTGGLLVSGGSIRKLLQQRLQKPITLYEDVNSGLYRVFSSQESKNLYLRYMDEEDILYDPEAAKDLELFNFVRPADKVLSIVSPSENKLGDVHYLTTGDPYQEGATLRYGVKIFTSNAGVESLEDDSFTVTLTGTNANGEDVYFTQVYNASDSNRGDSNLELNVYDQLAVGTNNLSLRVKANNSSALATMSITIVLFEFSIRSEFNYGVGYIVGNNIHVPIYVNRSDNNLPLTITVKVDNNVVDAVNRGSNTTSVIQYAAGQEINPSFTDFYIINTFAPNTTSSDNIKHRLTIEALLVSNNNTFKSNVLYYEFETIAAGATTLEIANKFINIGYSIAYSDYDTSLGSISLVAMQYEEFALNWAYFTYGDATTLPISWYLQTVENEEIVSEEPLSSLYGVKNADLNVSRKTLSFIPSEYTETGQSMYLVVKGSVNNSLVELDRFPIKISQSIYAGSIVEKGGYVLKLSAFGKSNESLEKDVWADVQNNIYTTFTGFGSFDNNTGWSDNALVVSGQNSYATINYNPFPFGGGVLSQGRTIEVKFKTENVVNSSDVIMSIGNIGSGNSYIAITPTKASVYINGSELVHTDFKANEEMHLTFIFNRAKNFIEGDNKIDGNYIFIVNNGILERAATYTSLTGDVQGEIKIGGVDSGIRVYMIRAYNQALTYDEALNNYIYDSSDKSKLITRNNIVENNEIKSRNLTSTTNVLTITGELDNLFNGTKETSETDVDIKFTCNEDSTRNFELFGGKIRKHGQSTLNYPITSLKFWTNKSRSGQTVVFTPSESVKSLGLNKNRWIMKKGNIPANKFVLLANYADSSGVHNGGLLRLIQDTWYSAVIDGEYKLRTAPQLFTSNLIVHHNDANLGEVEESEWTEGYSNVSKWEGKTWSDITEELTGKRLAFPYTLRVAPDSMPCVVFYKNTQGDGIEHFLGQYVFMDDKKSDFTFGERSIYAFGNCDDPFAMKSENNNMDKSANRVWNNNNVLKIEDVLINNTLNSYMSGKIPTTFEVDENGDIIPESIAQNAVDFDIAVPGEEKFYWENYFEMIYPDPDDIAETDAKNNKLKTDDDSKFSETAANFVKFLKWITGIGDLNSQAVQNGEPYIEGTRITLTALDEFIRTAHDHLDLHKMAAYYIFFIRFGLVDSVERNALIKTYDGIHWHYEPWDMDIALGNTNDGRLIYNPPLSRDTLRPGSLTGQYAFSGRSSTTSNVLWDCLEAWEYWSDTIVPKVAEALYDSGRGLGYSTIMDMFDNNYANKWAETIYNYAGHFKYIGTSANPRESQWIKWLQGARTSHRHWWVSTSMNYYDSKWGVGTFKEHDIYFNVNKNLFVQGSVNITPTLETYFTMVASDETNETKFGTQYATKYNPAEFDLTSYALSDKAPIHIYGATFIEELDVSEIASDINIMTLDGAYDNVLGAPIKVLNVGMPFTVVDSTTMTGKLGSGGMGTNSGMSIVGRATGSTNDALSNLKTFNIRGQRGFADISDFLNANDRQYVQNLYSAGSYITTFTSSEKGNKFQTLELPARFYETDNINTETLQREFTTFIAHNTNWLNLEFWDTHLNTSTGNATLNKVGIPTSISTITFDGSTASNECSWEFVSDFIEQIRLEIVEENQNSTADEIENLLLAALGDKALNANNIDWGTGTNKIYYKDLRRLAHFNHGVPADHLTGYILLSDAEALTSAQLNQIVSWFGNSVFNINTTSSNLVVDHVSNYVQISVSAVSGDEASFTINEETGNAQISEGHSLIMKANRFHLGQTSGEGYIWSLENAGGAHLRTIGEVKGPEYTGQDKDDVFIDENGNVYLDIVESTSGTNYTVTVVVEYQNTNGDIEYARTYIEIIAVTYPSLSDFTLNIVAASAASPTIARKFDINPNNINFPIFQVNNVNVAYQNVNNPDITKLRPTYVIYNENILNEFYFTWPSSYTASIRSIRYSVTINGVDLQLPEDLTKPTTATMPEIIELDQTTHFGYAVYSSHNGVVLGVAPQISGNSMPANMVLYQITCTILYKSGGRISIPFNIILYDDSTLIVGASTNGNASLRNILQSTYNALYLNNTITSFYKQHLYNITGTIDFSSNTNLQSIDTELHDSVLNYMPNITGINANGCSQLTGTIDLTACPKVQTVDLRNTYLNINIPEDSIITSVQLGSPQLVTIDSPTNLVSSNVSVQSSSNLAYIKLNTINKTNAYTFNTLNNIL